MPCFVPLTTIGAAEPSVSPLPGVALVLGSVVEGVLPGVPEGEPVLRGGDGAGVAVLLFSGLGDCFVVGLAFGVVVAFFVGVGLLVASGVGDFLTCRSIVFLASTVLTGSGVLSLGVADGGVFLGGAPGV